MIEISKRKTDKNVWVPAHSVDLWKQLMNVRAELLLAGADF